MKDSYLCASITFREVSVRRLGNFSISEENLNYLIKELGEVFYLQTCNRVELYTYDNGNSERILSEFLKDKWKGVKPIIYRGRNAIEHLFRVASGLESMSIGETEIMHQIKSAYKMEKGKYVRNRLAELIEYSLRVGKYVRSLTDISAGRISIYSLAINSALKEIGNPRRILIVGAGYVASRIAKILNISGFKDVYVVNRDSNKGKGLADKYGFNYSSFSNLRDLLKQVDIAFIAIYYPTMLLDHFVLEELNRLGKKIIIVDLSVPPLVPYFKSENVKVIGLEDLEENISKNILIRQSSINKANEIIKRKVEEFENRLEYRYMSKEISSMASNLYNEIYVSAIKGLEVYEKGKIRDKEEIAERIAKSVIKKVLSSDFKKIREFVGKNNTSES
jgi:glutamyl-tRNA reductase